MKLIEKYVTLRSHFTEIEKKTENLLTYSDNGYLVLRLDGIGLSKKYLKNNIRNKKFEGSMWSAMDETFNALHRKCPHDAHNIILGAIICSDEVSIILSNIPTYYDYRIIKTLTTFASTFTYFFTLMGMNRSPKKTNQLIAGPFDGRALFLESLDEVSDYITYRYAISIRNSLTKLIRLSGVFEDSEIYSEHNYNNMSYISETLTRLNSTDDINEVFKSPVVFISKERELSNNRFDSIEQLQEWINVGLKYQRQWLNTFI
ncbi:tRNA(His) guanylyltransferase Thg1 family protein [Plesiomonas shigelloides]|uniref:tRNA(His) guanylyltransferase Thg1 family protein n=1 Tax=Plesiomonas shigelloides TaxID=703 RepID=UPI000A11669B|nr:tRNA(His) guanylyltransferase Thg1 family protein [Plesiomonas shigelloides]